MTDRTDAEMAQVIAEMSVISEQRARSYEGVQVHGGDKAAVPSLAEKPMVDYWRDRYNGAHSLSSRLTVLEEARQALAQARRRVVPGEPEPGSIEWRVLIAEDERPIDEIVRFYMVSRATVYRYRAQYSGVRRGSVRRAL